MKRPTRKEIKEALNTVPIDQVLGVKGELTHKQKTFARLIAQGNTAAGAYRQAYDTNGNPVTTGNDAHKLKKNPKIAAEIEAYKLAQQAAEYQTPAHLRALVIQTLVQTVIDPETKPAVKVQAAKVLGTVTEVAAFTERREVRTVKTSEDAKAELMAKLRQVMTKGATDVLAKDATSLLDEISGSLSQENGNVTKDSEDGNVTVLKATPQKVQDAERDPHTPEIVQKESHGSMHSIPDTHTSQKSDTPSNSAKSLESELMETPPLGKTL